MWHAMMMRILAALVLATGLPAAAMAQATVAPPVGVQSTPLPPPPGANPPAVAPPAAEAKPAEAPPAVAAPAVPVPALPAPDANATLAGKPGDPSDIDEIMLVGKPVAIIAGQTTWDQGFQQLQGVFNRLKAETAREGLKITGRPLTLFIETDDIGYRFEAMLPVDRIPEGKTTIGDNIRFGTTPAGKAMRFTHKAPYEDIDSTYETITAYLEAKGVTVKDAFLEEYVSELIDTADPNLELNVYVQPK
jgi:effector-binding domain-containing protein